MQLEMQGSEDARLEHVRFENAFLKFIIGVLPSACAQIGAVQIRNV